MAQLSLEIVEGPGSGQQVSVDRPLTIGRAPDADLVLQDGQASRHHARVSPAQDGSAVVEDLQSANGTFVNHNELAGPARLDAGDELLIGVTVMQLRTQQQIAAQPSAVRAVPPGVRMEPQAPTYVNPAVVDAETRPDDQVAQGDDPAFKTLNPWRDVKVRRLTHIAPLVMLVLVAICIAVYYATK
jgi:pSer/pThr/pTyr-binding forkhead associated (FHA) protein